MRAAMNQSQRAKERKDIRDQQQEYLKRQVPKDLKEAQYDPILQGSAARSMV